MKKSLMPNMTDFSNYSKRQYLILGVGLLVLMSVAIYVVRLGRDTEVTRYDNIKIGESQDDVLWKRPGSTESKNYGESYLSVYTTTTNELLYFNKRKKSLEAVGLYCNSEYSGFEILGVKCSDSGESVIGQLGEPKHRSCLRDENTGDKNGSRIYLYPEKNVAIWLDFNAVKIIFIGLPFSDDFIFVKSSCLDY
jgi:hypothetical protein